MNKNKMVGMLLLIMINACHQSETTVGKDAYLPGTDSVKEDSSGMMVDSIISEIKEPSDNEIREMGIINDVEDGPYPMFTVTIEFPEKKLRETFNLNIENIGMPISELVNLKSKYVSFFYTSEMENNVEDIQVKSKSLLGKYAPEIEKSWEKTTGILRGAESESGDLPGEISVLQKNGATIRLKVFVSPEIVRVNGKEVTVYYSSRGNNSITYLKAVKD